MRDNKIHSARCFLLLSEYAMCVPLLEYMRWTAAAQWSTPFLYSVLSTDWILFAWDRQTFGSVSCSDECSSSILRFFAPVSWRWISRMKEWEHREKKIATDKKWMFQELISDFYVNGARTRQWRWYIAEDWWKNKQAKRSRLPRTRWMCVCVCEYWISSVSGVGSVDDVHFDRFYVCAHDSLLFHSLARLFGSHFSQKKQNHDQWWRGQRFNSFVCVYVCVSVCGTTQIKYQVTPDTHTHTVSQSHNCTMHIP